MKAPHVCILQTSFAKRDDTIAFLKERVPGVRVEFITDSTLLTDVRAAGGPHIGQQGAVGDELHPHAGDPLLQKGDGVIPLGEAGL